MELQRYLLYRWRLFACGMYFPIQFIAVEIMENGLITYFNYAQCYFICSFRSHSLSKLGFTSTTFIVF